MRTCLTPDTRLKPGANERGPDWLIWQLADSAFPTGGFAHSAGLEAAWQHGEVRHRDDLVSFVDASLNQLARGAVPFVTAAHAEPDRLAEFDQLCEAFTSNHVANRASRVQGRAWLAAVERIFAPRPSRGLSSPQQRSSATVARDNETGALESPWTAAGWKARAPWGHLAPIFGAVTRQLGLSRDNATRLFIFHHLRGLLAAAVRLNIIGPMEAQAVQHRQSAAAERIATRSASLTLADLAQTAPLLDVWQGGQDRLYARLFRS